MNCSTSVAGAKCATAHYIGFNFLLLSSSQRTTNPSCSAHVSYRYIKTVYTGLICEGTCVDFDMLYKQRRPQAVHLLHLTDAIKSTTNNEPIPTWLFSYLYFPWNRDDGLDPSLLLRLHKQSAMTTDSIQQKSRKSIELFNWLKCRSVVTQLCICKSTTRKLTSHSVLRVTASGLDSMEAP